MIGLEHSVRLGSRMGDGRLALAVSLGHGSRLGEYIVNHNGKVSRRCCSCMGRCMEGLHRNDELQKHIRTFVHIRVARSYVFRRSGRILCGKGGLAALSVCL